MKNKTSKQTSKPKIKKARVKVRSRAAQAASIHDFARAVSANLEDAYWETAMPILDGAIRPEEYKSEVARLQALKDAGNILRSTLVADEDDEDDEGEETDEEDRIKIVKDGPQGRRGGAKGQERGGVRK